MPKVVDHDQRRRELSELAYQIITQDGFDAATYRALADRAGCTTGMIVHYFPKRDDILLGALSHAETVTRAAMDYCLENYPGLEALRQCLFSVIPANRKLGSHWRLWISFWGRATSNENLRNKQRKAYGEAIQRWGAYIKKAQDAGALNKSLDVRSEAQGVMALLDGLGVQAMVGRGSLTGNQQKRMIDTYLDGLQRR